ncbi:MAG: group III truncated hemoglobin [Proteobacteria bacterium]|nr:group III truncated hemoglobin [Pseudomonadota bacterium]
MTFAVRSAEERRKEIQARAAAMGIDDAYISLLVDSFYHRVRAHPELGPIFDERIGDNWDPHLAKMKSFWSSVALNSGSYSGRPVPVHKSLSEVNKSHFETWLSLFQQTLEETAPTEAVVPYFMERAFRIAESLQLAMFGYPGIPGSKAS